MTAKTQQISYETDWLCLQTVQHFLTSTYLIIISLPNRQPWVILSKKNNFHIIVDNRLDDLTTAFILLFFVVASTQKVIRCTKSDPFPTSTPVLSSLCDVLALIIVLCIERSISWISMLLSNKTNLISKVSGSHCIILLRLYKTIWDVS